MRGQDQGRKPLVKVSCTRPHFTRQPREGEKKEREREGGGEEMGRGGKKNKTKQHKRRRRQESPPLRPALPSSWACRVAWLLQVLVSQSLEVPQPAWPQLCLCLRLSSSLPLSSSASLCPTSPLLDPPSSSKVAFLCNCSGSFCFPSQFLHEKVI